MPTVIGSPKLIPSFFRVKSEILTQLDGINSCDDPEKSVLLLGATNFPWALDEALRRRLDKRVYIPLPDVEGRKELLKISLKNSKVSSDVDFDELAKRMDYFSGADISHVYIISTSFPPLISHTYTRIKIIFSTIFFNIYFLLDFLLIYIYLFIYL